MFDDLDVLRSSPELQQLLSHYIQSTPEDQEAWLDRLMELEGVEPQDLVKLHGKLIAFSWLERELWQHSRSPAWCCALLLPRHFGRATGSPTGSETSIGGRGRRLHPCTG